jgi:hypothetical protein
MARRATPDPIAPNPTTAATAPAAAMPDPVAGNGAVASELAALRPSVDRLEQGLTQLAETTATHMEMLRALLAAATVSTEPELDLAGVLSRLVARLDRQSGLLRAIGASMASLPEDVGGAVGRQVASALADLR